jgi:hypothetical protein
MLQNGRIRMLHAAYPHTAYGNYDVQQQPQVTLVTRDHHIQRSGQSLFQG